MRCPHCHTDIPDDSLFCRRCGNRVVPLQDLLEGPTLTMPVAGESFVPGTTFAGRYRIIEDLGEGGMGRVYKVFDTQIGEKLALKLILPEIAAERRTIERFQNELKFARRVSHKNVCRMYHLSREQDTYFITMEYIEGENLRNMLRMTKKMSWAAAVHIAGQVCDGLAEAHRLGVVHRDLKPHNIIIDREGNVRIMDFGVARSLKTEEGTGSGIVIGTPEYMSPEQTEGGEADPRSDIYSLGIILYEMVTGRVPFESNSFMEVMDRQRNEPPAPPGGFSPEIPESLNRLILRCLEKKKEDRYQTAEELGHDLERLESRIPRAESGAAQKKTPPSRELTVTFQPRRLILPAALLLGALGAAFLIWRWIAGKAPPPSGQAVNMAVISFANQTGDSSYDYLQEAIPNLLITSLEQSESIRVMPWERILDLLKRLGKQNVRLIDADLGFELCRMDGIDLIVLGSYVKAGNMFATDVKIHEVRTRRLLKSTSARGEGVDSILKKQIDDLSSEITRWLVEVERTPRGSATPISEVTTASMEAYSHFLKGREAFERMYLSDARANLERAIAIDPDFPLAYIYLARVHAFMGNGQDVTDSLEEFKRHQRKIPGKEGLYLEALKARYVDTDPDKYFVIMQQVVAHNPDDKRAHVELAQYYQSRDQSLEAIGEYQKALEIDPEFGYAINLLAYAYLSQRDFDKAIEFFQKYIALYPDEANPHDSMAEAYFFLGQYDRAVEKYRDALRIKPDFGADFRVGYCYAVQENYAEALRWTDQFISATPSNSEKARGYLLKGYYYQLLGRVSAALKEWDAAEALLRSVQDEYNINILKRSRLWTYFDWGQYDQFWKTAQDRMAYRIEHKLDSEALNRSYLKYYEGFYELGLSRTDAAAERLAEVKSAFSQAANQRETELMRQAYSHLSSEILLARGKIEDALAEFQKAPQPQLSFVNINALITANFPFRADFAARAQAAKGELDQAIAEYERILLPGKTGGHVVHPLARFRLARLFEERGLRARAVEQYSKIAAIWTDAEPDLPWVRDMRARLVALQTR